MGKIKDQKRNDRRRRIEHERNLRHNKPHPLFMLYVKMEKGWLPAKEFFSQTEVDAHIASIEDLRKRNASDIVEAVILNVKTREKICTIPGHTMADPAFLKKHRDESGNQKRPGDIIFPPQTTGF